MTDDYDDELDSGSDFEEFARIGNPDDAIELLQYAYESDSKDTMKFAISSVLDALKRNVI